MKNVFQIIGEEPEVIEYDRWGTVFPDGTKLAAPIGPDGFNEVLMGKYGTQEGRKEWASIMSRMREVGEASQALTSMSLREDVGVIRTAALRYPGGMIKTLKYANQLTAPFKDVMEELDIKDPFVKNWLDMLCFLLQGLPAEGAMNAVIGYMLQDWYKPGVTLDFPRGGSGGIVDALVRGIEREGGNGEVRLNTHVTGLMFDQEGSRCTGVKCGDGTVVTAREAVVCNLTPHAIKNILGDGAGEELKGYVKGLANNKKEEGGVEDLKSFIHLHAAIKADGLPKEPSADFPAQWAVIRDWDSEGGVEAERNIVLCTMTSLIDDTLAPEGYHVLHAYVPATEPYCKWEGLDRRSPEYKAMKDEAEDFLWKALEEYIPNGRERAVKGTVQVGTPLTHERFLRREGGSYGPRAVAGVDTLPAHKAKGAENLWFEGGE